MTEKLGNNENAIVHQLPAEDIKSLILTIRGMQVLLDSDVARLYGYEVRRINEAAKRNINRFPERFRFQLTRDEFDAITNTRFVATDSESQIAALNTGVLRSQSATLKPGQGEHRKYLPYAYTEQGIGMLSGMLKNDTAVQVSIGIMDAFVEMRRFIGANRDVFAKLVSIDNKLLEHDRKFDEVFDLLQQPETVKQCIFYKGELYDAAALLIGLIKQATASITVIDNYLDGSVLDMLAEKQSGVSITIITANPGKVSQKRLQSFAIQYGAVRIVKSHDFHDRFIILDDSEVYAVGASLKDAGRRCFEVSKNEDTERFIAYIRGIIG
jgi:hypothetical protein